MWQTPTKEDCKSDGPKAEEAFRNGTAKSSQMRYRTQVKTAAWGTPRVSRGQYMSGKDGEKLLTLEGQLAAWPTPDASDAGKTSRSGDRKDEMLIGGLVRTTWPTPQARDMKGQTQNAHRMDAVPNVLLALGNDSFGCLAPMESFVERLMNLSMWLMGYTAAYLARWEIASSRKSRSVSSDP